MDMEAVGKALRTNVLNENVVGVVAQFNFDGQQVVVRFKNGWGASVIKHSYSHGVELAVIKFTWPDVSNMDDYELRYDTPITGDVLGWLTPEELQEALEKISKLTPNGNLPIEQ